MIFYILNNVWYDRHNNRNGASNREKNTMIKNSVNNYKNWCCLIRKEWFSARRTRNISEAYHSCLLCARKLNLYTLLMLTRATRYSADTICETNTLKPAHLAENKRAVRANRRDVLGCFLIPLHWVDVCEAYVLGF